MSIDPVWAGIVLTLIPMMIVVLAWYIRTVVRSATDTIRNTNGGSNLADMPGRLDKVEKSLVVLTENQLTIMGTLNACPNGRHRGGTDSG